MSPLLNKVFFVWSGWRPQKVILLRLLLLPGISFEAFYPAVIEMANGMCFVLPLGTQAAAYFSHSDEPPKKAAFSTLQQQLTNCDT